MIFNIKYAGEKFNFNQEDDWIGEPAILKLRSYYIADILFEVMDVNNFIDYCNTTFKKDKIEGMLYTLINAYQLTGEYNKAIEELDYWLLDNPSNQRMKNKKQKVLEKKSIQ